MATVIRNGQTMTVRDDYIRDSDTVIRRDPFSPGGKFAPKPSGGGGYSSPGPQQPQTLQQVMQPPETKLTPYIPTQEQLQQQKIQQERAEQQKQIAIRQRQEELNRRVYGGGSYDISKQTYTPSGGQPQTVRYNQVPPRTPVTASQNPYLFEKKIDEYRDERTGQIVPVTEVYYKSESGQVRKATEEERNYFRNQPGRLQAVSYERKTYEKYKPFIKAKEKVQLVAGEYEGAALKFLKQTEKEYPRISETLGLVAPEERGKLITSKGNIDIFYPFQFVSKGGERIGDLGMEYGKKKGSKALYYGGATVKAASWFIPDDILKLGGYYAFGKAPKLIRKGVSAAMVGGGSYQALKGESTEERIAGLIMAGLPVASYLREPIITKRYPGKTDITYKEVQSPVSMRKGSYTTAAYEMKIKETPPQVEISNRFRKALNFKPLKSLGPISKPKTSIVKTPFPSKLGEEFTVIEAGPRKKSVSLISGNEGKTLEYNKLLRAYPKLSKIDKKLVKETAGFERPTSEKNMFKLFKKEGLFSFSDIQETKYFKGARKQEFNLNALKTGFQPPGRRIKRGRAFSYLEELPTKDSSPFVRFRTRTTLKDVSKPFSRASGEVIKMKGEVIRFKEPVYSEEQPIELVRPSKTKTELKLLKDFSTMPKYTGRKTIKLTPSIEKNILNGAGTVRPAITPKIFSSNFIGPEMQTYQPSYMDISWYSAKAKPSLVYSPVTKNITKDITREIIQPKTKNMVKEIMKPQYKEIMKEQSKNLFKEQFKELYREQTKELFKSQLKEKQKQQLKQKIKPLLKTGVTTYRTPFRFPNPKIPALPGFRRRKKQKKTRGPGYDLILFEKGKPFTAVKGLSRAAALDLGTKKILTSVKASFGLRKSDLPGRDFSTGTFSRYKDLFRLPTQKSRLRKYGDIYVQRQYKQRGRGSRLFTRQEIKDISLFRKRKKIK